MAAAYHPTVWRTCRMSGNPHRLRGLKAVLEEPSSAVGEIAEQTRLSVCHASEYLRALQARGLIQASRVSRWMRYVARPDPLVAGISGIYPHLAVFNVYGECGIGAVVPWAEKLWLIT
jgi:DNA-binding transcriptional ArsR family regulator